MNDRKPLIPPHSTMAEESVLGGLMLDASKIDQVAERLSESDFYTGKHRAIYRAIMELSSRGQPCDAVTLGDWFDANDLGQIVTGSDITQLAIDTPSAANILAYAHIVREKSVRRQMIDACSELVSSAYSADASGMELLDAGIADLMAMQRTESRYEYTLRQAVGLALNAAHEAMQLPDGAIPGLPTGIKRLDQVLGGWHDGDLTVIGARPAMGKTALLLNQVLACGVPCGIISAEQPAQQIGARVMSIESGVAAVKMRNGKFAEEDHGRLDMAARKLLERNCSIYDRSGPSIADVSRITRRWKQQNGIRALFVDYVQRIEASDADRRTPKHEKVGEVVRGLKNLARDLGIPVIALAQVGRHVEQRQDRRPHMGDMSDSSEIEKEADEILTLYRESAYDPECGHSIAEISVEKNRHGPCGTVECVWIPETMRFAELAHE